VILGTLLVSIAAARGRFLRQWAVADRRLAAVRAADALLADWMAGAPQNIPMHSQGTFPGLPNCSWTTHVIPGGRAADLQAIVVRFEVFDRAAGAAGDPLFNVDFLLHDFRKRSVPVAPANGGR
jgi:hypothetical protein